MNMFLRASLCIAGALFATSAAAVDPGPITTFEKAGNISLLVSGEEASAPSNIVLPAASGAPHGCDEDYYPAMEARMRRQGQVLLSMRITEDGRVASLTVSEPNRYERLNEASLACVRNWTYTPALRDGRPVEALHTVQVIWRIREYGSRLDM